MTYSDRCEAGRVLAGHLAAYADTPGVLVLGLPRGGVPVAAEVAAGIDSDFDVFVVRKLGVPGNEELAMGAVASGDVTVRNEAVITAAGVTEAGFERVRSRELTELRLRECHYRQDRAARTVSGRTVIVVDDGLATGASMRAAVTAVRHAAPARLVVAVPVAAAPSYDEIRSEVDDAVCPLTPAAFRAVGEHYQDFAATSDDEVRRALASRL